MADGHLAERPFSRRPLVPAVVRSLAPFGTLGGRFFAVNLFGTLATIVGLWFITATAIRRAGRSVAEARLAATAACSLYALSPFSFRLTTVAPVLTDNFAAGAFTLWLACVQRSSQRVSLIAPILAAVAVLTRDAAILPIAATSCLSVALGLQRWRYSLLCLLASGLAFCIDLSLPSLPGAYRALEHFRGAVEAWLVHDQRHIFRTLFMSFGCTVLALTPWALRRMKTTLEDPKQLTWLLPAALLPALLSLFGGYDHGRIAAGGMPIFCALFAAQLILQPLLCRVLTVPAMIIKLVYWDVLGEVTPSESGYERYFHGWSIASGWDATLIVATFTIAMLGQRLQARPSTRRSG